MDRLDRMAVFASVVESKGFSAAARKLGVTRSAVSRKIGDLEKELGVRLLNRTTRRLSLTEAGETYYHSCARVVAEADKAERAVRNLHSEPTGTLRINGPMIGHRLLVPVLAEYLQRHPAVAVDLSLEDHYVNLVEEGIDLAIRIGHPAESGLIARKLTSVPQVVCGAPAYLDRRGRPASPADLVNHEWVLYSLLSPPDRFTFAKDGSRLTVRVNGRLRANSGPAIREALLAGHGITLIPRFYVEEEIASGRLELVLADYEAKNSSLYAVFPHRDPSSKVRLFVDALARRLSVDARAGTGC